MKAFSNALIETLTARNEEFKSADLVTAINNAKTNAKALDALFGSRAFDPVAKKLIANLAIGKQSDNREEFIAVKVVVKIIAGANAIAKNDLRKFDGYSQTIITNLVALQSISNKDALVSLSKAIIYNEDEQKAKLVARHSCSAGTAGTQASSTRMMLRALDVCEVLKSKRGDSLVIKSNERAQMLINLFEGKGTAMITAAGAQEVAQPAPKTVEPVKAVKPAKAKPAVKAEPAKEVAPVVAKKPVKKAAVEVAPVVAAKKPVKASKANKPAKAA
jgi:hypothetical protein